MAFSAGAADHGASSLAGGVSENADERIRAHAALGIWQLTESVGEGAKAVADEVWCYSTYIADMYVRAGIARERVHVVPLGYDPQIFKPGPAPLSATLRDRIAFLYVGDTIARKGVDVVVNAYLATFTPRDNVVLIVKDFGGKEPGGDTRLRDHVASLGGRRDIPPVLYIDTYYTDGALADLYRAATALVAPYRGEGFGLPILEAMACGVPTIATRGGASDDFTTKDTTIHVDAKPISLGKTYGGMELVDEAFLLEPDEEQVGAAMRRIYENPKLAQAMSAKSAEHARDWTWERGAERALGRIEALAKMTPLAKSRNGRPERNGDLRAQDCVARRRRRRAARALPAARRRGSVLRRMRRTR